MTARPDLDLTARMLGTVSEPTAEEPLEEGLYKGAPAVELLKRLEKWEAELSKLEGRWTSEIIGPALSLPSPTSVEIATLNDKYLTARNRALRARAQVLFKFQEAARKRLEPDPKKK